MSMIQFNKKNYSIITDIILDLKTLQGIYHIYEEN